MAGDWIKMLHDLPEKPEVISVAESLGLDIDTVLGKLHRLWSWFDRQTKNGRTAGVTASFLDAHCRCAGFTNALQNVGWIKNDGAQITLPKFDRHNSKSAKSRALSASRMKRKRDADSVTKRAPEKRREEKRREDAKDHIPLPPELTNEPFATAWSEWLTYRAERRLSTRDRTIRAQLTSLAPLGPVAAAECLRMSIRNGWQGIFPERATAGNGKHRTGPGQSHDPDATKKDPNHGRM